MPTEVEYHLSDDKFDYYGIDNDVEVVMIEEIIDLLKKVNKASFYGTRLGPTFFSQDCFDHIYDLSLIHCSGDITIWPKNLKKLFLEDFSILLNLPESLEELYYQGSSDINPITNLPNGLKILQFGYLFNHPLGYIDPDGNVISYLPPKLEVLQFFCDWDSDEFRYESLFEHSINGFLPDSIKYLGLSDKFNLPIDKYPSNLEILRFGYNFNQNVENLPETLIELEFGLHFNQRIDNLPKGLKKLILFGDFNQPIDSLPEGLLKLKFPSGNTIGEYPGKFNQPIENLPNNLKSLMIGSEFNQPLDFLPISLKKLIINGKFNQEINNLPPNLKKITICRKFNKTLINLPKSVEQLELFNDSAILPDHIKLLIIRSKKVPLNFPRDVERIVFNSEFNQPVDHLFNDEMKNLKTVEFGYHFNQTIDNLPDSVEELIIHRKFNQQIRKFPLNMKKLVFNTQEEIYFDLEILPKGLEVLSLKCKEGQKLINFPPNLKILVIDSKKDCVIENLPDSLRILALGYYVSNSIKNKGEFTVFKSSLAKKYKNTLEFKKYPNNLDTIYIDTHIFDIDKIREDYPKFNYVSDLQELKILS